MADDPMNYGPGEWTDAQPIAGMTPWVCSYIGADGHTYGITLYGTDPDQILEDNCDLLEGLDVEGQLVATAPAVPNSETGE